MVKLTDKRQTWAKNRKRVQFKGLPLHNPVSIEERYARELQALVRVMTKESQRELLAVFRGEVAEEFFAEDASITSLAKKTLNKLRIRFEKLFSDKANEVVQKMIAHVSKESKSRLQSSLKEMSGGLNVQLPDMPAQLKEVFAASVVENVALIKSIPQQYHDRITGAVMRSITSADGGIGKLTDELQKYSGMSLRRARLVAQDQTRKIYQAANIERSKSAGITKGVWIHTGGTKEPRPKHKAYNGKEFELAKGAPVGDNGEYVHCGEEVNCLPGVALLQQSNGINKLFRRWYRGKMTVLATESGKSLVITPNHPVLTQRGWVPANQVKLGDYVINAAGKGLDVVEANVDNGISEFGELFDSVLVSIGDGAVKSGPTTSKFHGDISNSKVDIVDIASFLPCEIDALAAEKAIELILSCAGDGCLFPHFSHESRCFERAMRFFGASDREVGVFNNISSFLGGKFGHSGLIGLASASDEHSAFFKSKLDCMSSNAKLFGEFKDALAFGVKAANLFNRKILALLSVRSRSFDLVSSGADSLGQIVRMDAKNGGGIGEAIPGFQHFDRILDNKFIDFSGHVYNLENERNWYVADGYIVHNCRCTFIPILDFGED